MSETTDQKPDLESGSSTGAFWLIILVNLIGVFNSLDLVLGSGPFEVLLRQIAAYIPHFVAGTVPNILAAALILVVTRHLAKFAAGTRRVFVATG
jgi:hypothetical protein